MPVTTHTEARSAMMLFYASYGPAADTEEKGVIAGKILEIASKMVMPEASSQFAEFVYARADEFTDEQRELAADIAAWAGNEGFWGLGVDMRGSKIAAVLRGQEVADPPSPSAEFTPPPPPEDMPEAPPIPGTEPPEEE